MVATSAVSGSGRRRGGGVVAVSAGAEMVIEGLGPGAPLAGVVGEFMERLTEELVQKCRLATRYDLPLGEL
jgi:hypothetical protein